MYTLRLGESPIVGDEHLLCNVTIHAGPNPAAPYSRYSSVVFRIPSQDEEGGPSGLEVIRQSFFSFMPVLHECGVFSAK